MKQKDRVLKAHTKTATVLLYVSGALQTHNGSRVPIDLQNDTEDYEEGTGEGGGEDDASESELNNQEGGWEDDAASTSSSESELNKLHFTRIFTTSRRPLLLNMSGATLPNFNQSGDI